jgi:hypothetical protein
MTFAYLKKLKLKFIYGEFHAMKSLQNVLA